MKTRYVATVRMRFPFFPWSRLIASPMVSQLGF